MSTPRYPDRSYFAGVASETGFGTEPLETVFRLTDLLNRLTDRADPELLLRGGTAVNLLYLDSPRLSVDVDLDFVGTRDQAEAGRRRPDLLREIEDAALRAGYRVTSERPSYAMSHQLLHYTNSAGRPRFLKVDVNFLDRVPVIEPETNPLRHPFGEDLPTIQIQTFTLPELVASKLIALVRRSLARDLFDVAMLSQLAEMDRAAVRNVLVVRGASYPPPGPDRYTVGAVDTVRIPQWRSEVMALARRPLPVELVRARELASALMEDVFSLEGGHLRFLSKLEEGAIEPETLALPERARVLSNPGLLWRLKVGAEGLEER